MNTKTFVDTKSGMLVSPVPILTLYKGRAVVSGYLSSSEMRDWINNLREAYRRYELQKELNKEIPK
jgi:hypothetical protein